MRGIALSGFTTEEDRRASMDSGFDEHLAKPVTLDALDAVMRRASFGTASGRSLAVLSA
jgi:DNA-binding response OmpR family regulator